MDSMDSSTRPALPPKPSRKLIDNAAEVRRRKEAAERLIRERHEALRRQHEEKIAKINEERQRQQRELKERHAKELKRQQDVLQRRMELMERDNARKKEILEKNHAVVSRLSANSSRKNYAFGSSTPRELSFLENKHSKNSPLEKRQSPEKNSSSSSVNSRRGRPTVSVMSTSMYVPSKKPERVLQTSSVNRLAHPKNSPSKQQDLMTQSVHDPSGNSCVTPVSRLRRKPLKPLTSSVPNTPLSSSVQSGVQKKQSPKLEPRTLRMSHVGNKRQAANSEQSDGSIEPSRKESCLSNETQSSLGGLTTESLLIDISLSDGVAPDLPEVESNNEVEVVEVELHAAQNEHSTHLTENVSEQSDEEGAVVANDNVRRSDGVASPEKVDCPEVNEEKQQEQLIETAAQSLDSAAVGMMPHEVTEKKESVQERLPDVFDTNIPSTEELISISDGDDANVPVDVIQNDVVQPMVIEKGGASLADELAGLFDAPISSSILVVGAEAHSPLKSPSPPQMETFESGNKVTDIEPQPELLSVGTVEGIEEVAAVSQQQQDSVGIPADTSFKAENTAEAGSPAHDVEDIPANALVAEVSNTPLNGYDKHPASVITAELPGTVSAAKDSDNSVVRKVPTPPNEFIAHRLRREQEQKMLDERKARIAAILAKSRDLSNATTPIVAGRISPPRGGSAQDVLKRLASNGNLPALQKLVARHTTEATTIEQFAAPEDAASQAI